MLRLFFISMPAILIACSSNRTLPVAPAGKAADLRSMFERFNQVQPEPESPADTSPDSTDAQTPRETPGDSEDDGQDTSPVVVDQNSPVSIPDKVLRGFLETALNKQPGETITWGDMASLKSLTIEEADDEESEKIVSLTGIEAATNLTHLYLLGGSVLYHHADGSFEEEIFGRLTDISLLASLTKLKELQVRGHPIENVDAFSQLTNLEFLSLRTHATSLPPLNRLKHLNQLHIEGPFLTDISGLQGLTSLGYLGASVPKLTDISVMQHLTSLKILIFSYPEVTAERLEDITPLENLTLEYVDLRGSPLSENSIKKTIPALQARGTVVHWDFPTGTFDIELVFLGESTEFFENLTGGIPYYWDPVRTRWEQIIRQDIPAYEFKRDFQSMCGNQPIHIAAGDQIDDLRVYVTVFEHEEGGHLGKGYPLLVRDSQLPAVGCVEIAKSGWLHELVAVHEIGHTLGIGTIWNELGLLKNPGSGTDYISDTHFTGSRAIRAFNDLGGLTYTGSKVPVEQGPTPHHWRGEVIYNELMSTNASGGNAALSAITIQALADLGYEVDASQADIHNLRIYPDGNAPAGKALADPGSSSCSLEGIPEPIYTSQVE
jgi:hypothetical protein